MSPYFRFQVDDTLRLRWPLETRDLRHQVHRLLLTGLHDEAGCAAILPCAIARTNPVRRPHQRTQIDKIVGHRRNRLLLSAREIKLLDTLGRLREALPAHQVFVEVLAARSHSPERKARYQASFEREPYARRDRSRQEAAHRS